MSCSEWELMTNRGLILGLWDEGQSTFSILTPRLDAVSLVTTFNCSAEHLWGLPAHSGNLGGEEKGTLMAASQSLA